MVTRNDRAGDVLAKVPDWLDAGCPLVTVVDPSRPTVAVYEPREPMHVQCVGEELGGGDIVPRFVLPVAVIFAM